MRILIPASKLFLEDKNANPFISLLYNGLRDRGFDVTCGLEEFWNRPLDFDVVFFQWPEAVFDRGKVDARLFQNHLDNLKGKVKIVATCHNLHAHNNDLDANMMYDGLYAVADAIHHLGDYSYRLFLDRYPNSFHFVAEHPIFYDILTQGLDTRGCRRKFDLPVDKKTLLSFGEFRNEEEKKMFFSVGEGLKTEGVTLFAPRLDHGFYLYQGWHLERSLLNLFKRIRLRMSGLYCRRGVVDCEDVPACFTTADVILIQRLEILNSGNVPLAFSAAKVVVGPDMGNVGELLRKTGNPVFDVNSREDITDKCKQAFRLAQSPDLGLSNYQYARQHMMPDQFIDTVASYLTQLVR